MSVLCHTEPHVQNCQEFRHLATAVGLSSELMPELLEFRLPPTPPKKGLYFFKKVD